MEYPSLRVETLDGNQIHIVEARVLHSYMDLYCIYNSWVVLKKQPKTVRTAITTGWALFSFRFIIFYCRSKQKPLPTTKGVDKKHKKCLCPPPFCNSEHPPFLGLRANL